MNKIKIFSAAVSILIGIFIAIIVFQNKNSGGDHPKVCINSHCFLVEIADDPSEQEIGLMERDSLDSKKGMLFVFEEENVYKFWMKNTLISLDMIWIDKDNKIVFIKENAQPCKADPCESFGSDEKAKYVLEINGGMSVSVGAKLGDLVEIILNK